jgi:hypothetical protein
MKTKLVLLSFTVLMQANYSQAQNNNLNTVAEKWSSNYCGQKRYSLKTEYAKTAPWQIAGAEVTQVTLASFEGARDNAHNNDYCDVILPKYMLKMVMPPARILSFNAECSRDKVTLSWSTFAEERNDCFIIEKSINGTDWFKLAEIKGTGKSDETNYYSLNDYNDYEVAYYRIKKGLYDGHMTYYHVVMGKED